MITRRPPRLPGFPYTGFQRYFLTTCTALRTPLFADGQAVERVRLQLQQCAAQFEFTVIAYCFMPDHLHLLLTGESVRADLREFVRRFKQRSSFEHRRQADRPLWQPGYYERILRDDEATMAVVRYILENPVRAGLTSELGAYPYAGSDRYNLEELLTAYEWEPERGRRT